MPDVNRELLDNGRPWVIQLDWLLQKNYDIVERADPRSLSTFSQCIEFPPHWGFKLMSSRSGVRRLTKWLASWMLVWVSAGFSTVLPPVLFWYCPWSWFSREVLSAVASGKWVCQASEYVHDMPTVSVTQPDRLTWSCDHVGVTTVERPDPKSLSTFSQCTELRCIGDSSSYPPDLELGALTKWLASRMLVWVSAEFSTIFNYEKFWQAEERRALPSMLPCGWSPCFSAIKWRTEKTLKISTRFIFYSSNHRLLKYQLRGWMTHLLTDSPAAKIE